MKAARLYAAGDLRVEDIAAPAALKPGWVKLDVTAAGICGSDLHNYRTGQWISRSPSVAGHELAGVVSELGPDVTGFKLGDSVVADSRYVCGVCPACKSGRQNVCENLGFIGEVCDGGFAEQCALPAHLLHKHDPAVAPEIAAMAEPLAVALHAIRKLRLPEGEPILVVGCGPIGGLAALLLSRLHRGPILVADRNQARAELVATVAGARVIALEADAISAVLGEVRLRYALDATGNINVLAQILALLGGGGALGLVGITHGKIDLDPNILVEREIALVGCHAFGDEMPEITAMLPDLSADLVSLIDEIIAIEDIPAAYERLLAGQAKGLKTIIKIQRGGADG